MTGSWFYTVKKILVLLLLLVLLLTRSIAKLIQWILVRTHNHKGLTY